MVYSVNCKTETRVPIDVKYKHKTFYNCDSAYSWYSTVLQAQNDNTFTDVRVDSVMLKLDTVNIENIYPR